MRNPVANAILLATIVLQVGERAWASESYRKTFPDGTFISLTKESILERRSRLKTDNPSVSQEKLFANREVKLITYSLLLTTPRSTEPSLIWEASYTDPDDLKSASWYNGEFNIIDTFISTTKGKVKVFVIYGTFFSILVKNFERDDDGKWSATSSSEIAKRSEITPPVNIKFLPTDQPQIYLEIFTHDRNGNERTYPQKWVLRSNQWRRK